jgi:hypothetical protein
MIGALKAGAKFLFGTTSIHMESIKQYMGSSSLLGNSFEVSFGSC